MSWKTNYFLNPFTQGFENPLFPKPQDFSFIFDHEKPKEWQIGALLTRLKGKDILTAKAKILGYFDGGKLKPPLNPIGVGIPVMLAKAEDMSQIFARGVRIGRVPDTDLDVHLDVEEVRTKHMAILGTTGSGKSYFVKLFITRIVDSLHKIFVLDPHGEYSNHLKELFNFNNFVEVKIPNTILFFDHEKLMKFLESYGVCFPHPSSSAHAVIQSEMAQKVSNCESLSSILSSIESALRTVRDSRGRTHEHLVPYLNSAIQTIIDLFGSYALENQNDVLERINVSLDSKEKVVIFNLKEVDEPTVRSEIAGYILKELFKIGKKSGDFNSILVLEEAHYFAPEKGYGEVSAGRENLSKLYAEKIASEGRKFGLGLIVVSQRPAQVSKFVLSQTNTQILFRIINDNDLKAIEQSIESVSRNIVDKLPDLKTGYAFVTGTGIEIPTLVEIM
jgi:DNA helicase HerA-like ATPase